MITERDLQEAITECQGVRNPNASTCIKLAAFLTIQREMFGNAQIVDNGYSFDAEAKTKSVVKYNGDTEFARLINGMDAEELWPIIDELMTAVQVINPRLYAAVLRKIKGVDIA